MPARYNPETYLPFSLPGLGLLLMLAFLTLVGMLTAGFAGRTLVRIGERLLSRMPVVRSVYGTLKQIFETVLAQKSRSFREVVMVEYPRRGLGAIGFVTGADPRRDPGALTGGDGQCLPADHAEPDLRVQPWRMAMVFRVEKPYSASNPFSRPNPEPFMPPNGSSTPPPAQ